MAIHEMMKDVPDDDYILDWSTNISPNLAKAMGNCGPNQPKVEALSKELSWKAPTTSGLQNSAPIFDSARRRSSMNYGIS